jgi:hypothetical protein
MSFDARHAPPKGGPEDPRQGAVSLGFAQSGRQTGGFPGPELGERQVETGNPANRQSQQRTCRLGPDGQRQSLHGSAKRDRLRRGGWTEDAEAWLLIGREVGDDAHGAIRQNPLPHRRAGGDGLAVDHRLTDHATEVSRDGKRPDAVRPGARLRSGSRLARQAHEQPLDGSAPSSGLHPALR